MRSTMKLRLGAVAVAAVAVFLATSTLTPPGAGTRASADAAITFGAPTKIPTVSLHDQVAASGGEPGIRVDSAGTIYYTSVCCVPFAAETYYSTDGGRTFQVMPSPAGSRENVIGAEGDFAVDDADRPIFADTSIADIRVTRWRDHGATWDRTTDASEQNPINDRPWIAWGKGSLYMYTNGVTGQKIHQSYDGGATWNPVEVGNWSDAICTFTANRQDGGLWSVCPNLAAHVSPDGGKTWNATTVAQPARGQISGPFGTSIATDEAGNGYAVWSTTNATGCDLYVAASTDHGVTWSEPVKVNATTGCSTFPWIDAGDPGHVVVVWYQTASKKAQDSVPASATWELHTAISTNLLSALPTFTEATLPGVTIDKGPLKRDVWDFFQVAVGPDGRFNIAYSEDTTGSCPQPGTQNLSGPCKTAWYVGQATGPLLHANRVATATSVSIDSATVSGGALAVRGTPVFKAAPSSVLFNGTSASSSITGAIKPVGPDSKELLFTMGTLPNGIPGFDGLPATRYGWSFKVDDVAHSLCISNHEQDGPHFRLDGKAIGGTIDGFGGKAIARIPMDAVGAHAGSAIVTTAASEGVGTCTSGTTASQPIPGAPTYVVPGATVTLSLRQAGTEVASGAGVLSGDATSYDATIDVSGVAPGTYDLVATACYAGDCSSTSTPVTI